jgi:hypothetical protein
MAVLDHAGHDHGARHIRERELVRLAQNGNVRAGHRALQEVLRIGKRRPRVALKRRAEIVDRDLRRELAAQMSAQAVGHHHEERATGAPVAQAVLVAYARADPRLRGERALQERLPVNLSTAPQS